MSQQLYIHDKIRVDFQRDDTFMKRLAYVMKGELRKHQPQAYKGWGKKETPLSKKFIFWDGKQFVCLNDVKSLTATAQLEATPDLTEPTQLYYKGPYGSPIKELFTKPVPKAQRRGKLLVRHARSVEGKTQETEK